MHSDHKKYFNLTGKYRLERSINSLLGLVQGVAIDREINHQELAFLSEWISDHEEVAGSHP
ncbi:MAG: NAD-dependent DNA ligase, partial [Caldilinea sp.]